MVLLVECIVACLIFGVCFVGMTLYKKTDWLRKYTPEVQERFLERNPNYIPKTWKDTRCALIVKKVVCCLVFLAILVVMVYKAGARNFMTGCGYCYLIWFVVNWFDVFALDLGVFMHWKKVRLPGTEDMDKEYLLNTGKSIKDGFIGMAIGIPVAVICGGILVLITR